MYLWTCLLNVGLVHAYFDNFFFSKDAYSCPGIADSCAAPDQVCAFDAVLQKHYCCGTGPGTVCWALNTTCGGGNGSVAGNVQNCGDASSPWCCLANVEKCTERYGQTNVCWAAQQDPLASVNTASLSKLYTSLVAAHPTENNLHFNPAALTATSTSTSTSSSGTSKATQAHQTTSDSVSGGDIGGIVVGAIAAIAIVLVVIWLILRRRKARVAPGTAQWPSPRGEVGYTYNEAPAAPYYASPKTNIELSSQWLPSEVSGESSRYEPYKPRGELP